MRSADRDELVSWTIAAVVFSLAVVFGSAELRNKLDLNELIARNEGEKTLSLLLSVARSVRYHDDDEKDRPEPPPPGSPTLEEEGASFVAAIEAHQPLKDRIKGFGIYDAAGGALFRYGSAPADLPAVGKREDQSDAFQRSYGFDFRGKTLAVEHQYPLFRKRPPRGEEPQEERTAKDEKGPVVYYEFNETDYFKRNSVAWVVFGIWIAAAAVVVVLVRWLTRKNALYRETLRAQSELVALGGAARTLAHEIKNPLSAIRLQADLVAKLCPGSAEEEVAGIRAETERIQILVDRIGDFLREPKGSPARVVIVSFAKEVLKRAGPGGGPVPVFADEGAEEAVVLADEMRLRSVLENIARNAYDAGGDPAEVAVSARVEGSAAVLEFSDRGSGIPEDIDPDRLFDPFFTTKTRGFGLGLALCRRFVEAAGGAVRIIRREGGGTIVRISIPKEEP